jgi:predicted enzyme related to lactoylglutathione lyase
MKTRLGRTIILVEDYDKAFSFYQKNFNCRKLFDQTGQDGRRYLHVAFSEDDKAGIWFLQPESPDELKYIGSQALGYPMMVIYTDNIEELYSHVQKNQVEIAEKLVSSPDSKFFHCFDLYGNKLTVVQLTGQKL